MPNPARCIVIAACLFWDGKRYDLHGCTVMPDHVHLLLTPLPIPDGEGYHRLSGILHSIKSYTADQINKLLGRTGSFWQDERHDRAIRTQTEFQQKLRYIVNNAVAAGLADSAEDYPLLYVSDWR